MTTCEKCDVPTKSASVCPACEAMNRETAVSAVLIASLALRESEKAIHKAGALTPEESKARFELAKRREEWRAACDAVLTTAVDAAGGGRGGDNNDDKETRR